MWSLIGHAVFVLIAAIALLRCPHAIAQQESDEELISRLADQWRAQQSAIMTAEIKYLAVHRLPTRKFAPHDLEELLKKANLPGTDASIKNLVGALDANLVGMAEPWSVKLFSYDGLNTRVDRFEQKSVESHVRRVDREVYTRRINNQVDVYSGESSRIRLDSLDDLRILPSERFVDSELTVERHQDGKIYLRRGAEELVVDGKTAFVYEHRIVLPGDIVRREEFQYGPKSYAGGTILPTVVFEADYSKGELKRFRLNAIVAATLNGQVPESVFVVPAKKGTTVVDHENGRKQVQSLDRDVPDIAKRSE